METDHSAQFDPLKPSVYNKPLRTVGELSEKTTAVNGRMRILESSVSHSSHQVAAWAGFAYWKLTMPRANFTTPEHLLIQGEA